MRRFFLAAVMFGAATGAQAADMPDFLRGSLPGGPAPTVNWQGFYVGGQGSMAFLRERNAVAQQRSGEQRSSRQ